MGASRLETIGIVIGGRRSQRPPHTRTWNYIAFYRIVYSIDVQQSEHDTRIRYVDYSIACSTVNWPNLSQVQEVESVSVHILQIASTVVNWIIMCLIYPKGKGPKNPLIARYNNHVTVSEWHWQWHSQASAAVSQASILSTVKSVLI